MSPAPAALPSLITPTGGGQAPEGADVDAQALAAQCALLSGAVFAIALGRLGGIATRKAGVQSTAWRGVVGASRGSGRSARAGVAVGT